MKKRKKIIPVALSFCLGLGAPLTRVQAAQASAATLDGIDISNWQAGLNVSALQADFVLVKASGGTSWVDRSFSTFANDTLRSNKLLGFYHFARESICPGSAQQEAIHFYNTVKPWLSQGIPVLDFEGEALNLGTAWAFEFLETFYGLSGVRPLLYTSAYYTRSLDWSSVARAGYQLWLAQYAHLNPVFGYLANPWTDGLGTGAFSSYIMHQYACTGRLSGWNGDLDLDKFYGSVQDWKALQQINTSALYQPMYRVYNPNSGEHFYTANEAEKNLLLSLGWQDENIGWIAPASGDPVYRVYNPNAGDHHYTLNRAERDHLVSLGWRDEGIGWYSATGKQNAIYRAYNPNATTGTHNYTLDAQEQRNLVSAGWQDEGIGWYAALPLNLQDTLYSEFVVTDYTGQCARAGLDDPAFAQDPQ